MAFATPCQDCHICDPRDVTIKGSPYHLDIRAYTPDQLLQKPHGTSAEIGVTTKYIEGVLKALDKRGGKGTSEFHPDFIDLVRAIVSLDPETYYARYNTHRSPDSVVLLSRMLQSFNQERIFLGYLSQSGSCPVLGAWADEVRNPYNKTEAEIGYVVLPPYRRGGLGLIFASTMVECCRKRPEIECVVADVFASGTRNLASESVMAGVIKTYGGKSHYDYRERATHFEIPTLCGN
jgi:RimJ/RimL family protein N-acetyltransferase